MSTNPCSRRRRTASLLTNWAASCVTLLGNNCKELRCYFKEIFREVININNKGWTPTPPPPYSQLFLIFFWCAFNLRSWLSMFWNKFCTRKKAFLSIYKNCQLLLAVSCCSVTNWSDSGIAGSLRTWEMHFWDPSQCDKMCFEYQRIKFQ